MSNAVLGMTMLGLIVIVIMMGFPTAFTLMGLGMVFGFIAFYDPAVHFWDNRIFDLMVQRAFGAMTNETLLSIPLFVLMGYIMERGALVDKMFHSVQLAFRSVPGSLAVTTLIICTFWGIASGLVGAVVVLMGVIAMRPMLNAGYDTRLAAGVITAGGTLGILIPPSVMIIVYAAVAGQSVVKLYAAAMFPGFFLALLYLIYIIGWVMLNPKIAPKLPPEQNRAPVPPWLQQVSALYSRRVLPALVMAAAAPGKALQAGTPLSRSFLLRSLGTALVPVAFALVTLGGTWWYVVIHSQADNNAAVVAARAAKAAAPAGGGLQAPAATGGVQEPPGDTGVKEPPSAEGSLKEPPAEEGLKEPPGDTAAKDSAEAGGLQAPPGSEDEKPSVAAATAADAPLQEIGEPSGSGPQTAPVPESFYTGFAIACVLMAGLLLWYYRRFDAEQFEILRMLVSSVMPLALLTIVVLGVILFGITTATESAAVGAAGAFLMAWHAGTLDFQKIKEAVFLTCKTTSMVCWLFVGSALFSAVFALLGGQRVVEEWVMSMNLTPLQFLLLSQAIIFILGWPLEWTEIIVIFVPIFLPLLQHFQIDPILWGVLVFVNLQAAFLSPPVAMSAFYLKGVSPPHVTINQIFAGMMPYMLIVILCMVFMYIWPGLTLWLPKYLYG
ncbi:TRAP-type mannitol/chloroaromatic compound transport system, large permease component [Polaromonas sp. YR568]|uniref:TRAP transporter large permease n=1 Tax=Polaromonas sp. YR568 TaxID=1855301 RepID=UPI0008EABADA|nr:TRAP transporter large permease subunit [Polaromonas sp. YR568]SFU77527.1 TRAP-type mannitol/chloroaromatic compound transport system, large permease component [Polaromonas sp. YR568]